MYNKIICPDNLSWHERFKRYEFREDSIPDYHYRLRRHKNHIQSTGDNVNFSFNSVHGYPCKYL